MRITYRDGEITGINREPLEGEEVLEVDKREFIFGYVKDYYRIEEGAFVAMTDEERDAYNAEQAAIQAAKDAEIAEAVAESAFPLTPQAIKDLIDSKFTKDMTEREAIIELIKLVKKLAIRTLI